MAEFSPIDLQKALSGADYPSSKKSLVDRARQNKADDQLVEAIEGAKQDNFDGPNEVQKAVFNR